MIQNKNSRIFGFSFVLFKLDFKRSVHKTKMPPKPDFHTVPGLSNEIQKGDAINDNQLQNQISRIPECSFAF